MSTAEELRRERDSRLRRVYNVSNEYGYTFNINNPILQAWYRSYVAKLQGKDGTEPQVRLAWEKKVHKYIKRKYKEIYHDDMREPVLGWTEQRVEELVQMLGGVQYDT